MSAPREAVTVRVRQLAGAEDLELPRQATAGSSGVDLRAAVTADLVLAPGERAHVPTGIALELPAGYEGQVRPRSGLALRHGVTLLNSPGTIDADYRGEIGVVVINLGREPFTLRRGDRIAQLVLQAVPALRLVPAESLAGTARGAGGFGHTGER